MMTFRRASLMSSIFSRKTLAEQGPTRFMLSTLAAISAVLTRSRLVGIVIAPVVRSFFECKSISILPMRPVFWSSLRSSSGPKSPSVCPKTAPITSGFSTTPSISNFASITYFMVNVWDGPVSVHLQGVSYLVRVNRMTRVCFRGSCDYMLIILYCFIKV